MRRPWAYAALCPVPEGLFPEQVLPEPQGPAEQTEPVRRQRLGNALGVRTWVHPLLRTSGGDRAPEVRRVALSGSGGERGFLSRHGRTSSGRAARRRPPARCARRPGRDAPEISRLTRTVTFYHPRRNVGRG